MTKRKEIEFKITDQKHIRYKSTLLYMDAYFDLDVLKYLSGGYNDFFDKKEIREYLKSEYHAMLLYASPDVLSAVKNFIELPSIDNYYGVSLAMRKDLWIKKDDLDLKKIELI